MLRFGIWDWFHESNNGCVCKLSSFSISRFTTAEGTSKNRIVAPGKVMHFYNSPPDSTEESLIEVCPFAVHVYWLVY